jgi:hypothetical protein
VSESFQVSEEDLAELEHTLPKAFMDLQMFTANNHPSANRVRVQFSRVQKILTNIRWRYGPWEQVQIVDPNEPPEATEQGRAANSE